MIQIQDIAEIFQNILNNNQNGLTFEVHTTNEYMDFSDAEMQKRIRAGITQILDAGKIPVMLNDMNTNFYPVKGVIASNGEFGIEIPTRDETMAFKVGDQEIIANATDYIRNALDAIFQTNMIGNVYTIQGKEERIIFYPDRVNAVFSDTFNATNIIDLFSSIQVAFSQNGFYGNDLQYSVINSDGTESPISPVNRDHRKEFTATGYQNLNAITTTNISMQNAQSMELIFVMLNEPFYIKLLNLIETDTYQNTQFTIRKNLPGVYDTTQNWILQSAEVDYEPNGLISMDCIFVRADKILEEQNDDTKNNA